MKNLLLFLIIVLIIVCTIILILALMKLLQGDVNTSQNVMPLVVPSLLAGILMFYTARKL
jgi:hypothetical protein